MPRTTDNSAAPKASRTVPIPGTLDSVPSYPNKLKIYMMAASAYWQVRYYDNGKTIKLSTGTPDKRGAIKFAKAPSGCLGRLSAPQSRPGIT
jgi:hypothetical protein